MKKQEILTARIRQKKKKKELMEEQLEKVLNGEDLDNLEVDREGHLFNDFYDIIEIIGRGAFGVVVSAVEIQTGDDCAIKIISKETVNPTWLAKLRQEAEILSMMSHKNVVKFKHVRESMKHIFIVMELVLWGSLQKLITEREMERRELTQEELATIMKSILEAISYIHTKDISHRDLKPENILIHDPKDLSTVKIVDFGMGIKYEMQFEHKEDEKCGTAIFMAPEQAMNIGYSKAVDIWACGIIMFILITGKHPLYDKNDTKSNYVAKLRDPEWSFPSQFSEYGENLFLQLCKKHPIERYNASQALRHPWITGETDGVIPLTNVEEMKLFTTGKSLRDIIRVVYFLSWTRTREIFISLDQYSHLINFGGREESPKSETALITKFRLGGKSNSIATSGFKTDVNLSNLPTKGSKSKKHKGLSSKDTPKIQVLGPKTKKFTTPELNDISSMGMTCDYTSFTSTMSSEQQMNKLKSNLEESRSLNRCHSAYIKKHPSLNLSSKRVMDTDKLLTHDISPHPKTPNPGSKKYWKHLDDYQGLNQLKLPSQEFHIPALKKRGLSCNREYPQEEYIISNSPRTLKTDRKKAKLVFSQRRPASLLTKVQREGLQSNKLKKHKSNINLEYATQQPKSGYKMTKSAPLNQSPIIHAFSETHEAFLSILGEKRVELPVVNTSRSANASPEKSKHSLKNVVAGSANRIRDNLKGESTKKKVRRLGSTPMTNKYGNNITEGEKSSPGRQQFEHIKRPQKTCSSFLDIEDRKRADTLKISSIDFVAEEEKEGKKKWPKAPKHIVL